MRQQKDIEEEQYDGMAAYIEQGTDINGQLILLMFIAVIMGMGKGGVPGFATVATALTVATAPITVVGGMGYAVALQVPILAMIDISVAYFNRNSIDWPTVVTLLPLTFVGMGMGQVLDKFMTDASARVLVGCILLSILTVKVYKDVLVFVFSNRHIVTMTKGKYSVGRFLKKYQENRYLPIHESASHKKTTNQQYAWAAIVGLFGGAATMLTNSMGPIVSVYLLSVRKLSPTEYIGTQAIFFCFMNILKVPIRFLSGTLGWAMMPLAAALGFVSILGVICAKPIMLSMKESTFVKLELTVVAFAGVRLVWLGLTTV